MSDPLPAKSVCETCLRIVVAYSWSLLGNNSMVINLQMFTSNYGSSVLPHVTRAPTEGFFHPDLFFKPTWVCRFQWPTQKISEGGQVLSQSCDVTNKLAGGMPPGKFCKISPKNTHFCAFWKQVSGNTVFTFFYFYGLRGWPWHSGLTSPYASVYVVVVIRFHLRTR